MNFISMEYLFFVPAVIIFYWLIPEKYRVYLLLIVSYAFYFYWNSWSVLLLMGTTLLTFFIAIQIGKTGEKRKKRIWMSLAILICLGCLFIFKYLGFFSVNVSLLLQCFGSKRKGLVLSIFLPVGISFYTFQNISYVIDVYRGILSPEKKPVYYALYVCFFPQLVAGPIERSSSLLTQLHSLPTWNTSYFILGLQNVLQGLFKKIVIADYCAIFVDRVYGDVQATNGPATVFATVLFAVQIYCDFSGYTDIAIGTAQIMGIRLMQNFDSPYRAVSMRDFWHRWHISLTSWFTDYIYIPLGGNRKGTVRQYFNIMIVFLLSGMWHGASWTFIVWGCIHGSYLVIEKMFMNWWNKKVRHVKIPYSTSIKRVVIFTGICFAWIFFRANSMLDAILFMKSLCNSWSVNGIKQAFSLMQIDKIAFVHIILVLVCLTNLNHVSHDSKSEIDFVTVYFLVSLVALGWLSLLATNTGNSFIYFKF